MRTILAVLCISLLCFSSAMAKQIKDARNNPYAACEAAAFFAEKITEARYNGVTIHKIMSLQPENSTWVDIIHQAYDLPAYNTHESQKKAGRELASHVYLRCVAGLKKETRRLSGH